jgi:SapC protein
MVRHVLLNNVTHRNLRVITRHAAEFGDDVGSVLTFPTEYGDVQREYPIFFRKDPATGDWFSVAILGFQKNENLFLDETGWHASYVPGAIARGPFLIGFQEQDTGGDVRRNPVIHVNMDDPRVSETEGEPVFLPQGGNSRYLEHIVAILDGIHTGVEAGKAMYAEFDRLNLIEPVKVEVKVSDEETYDLVGLYTISEERLRALDGDALVHLNRTGFLHGAFLVLSSMNNMKKLIDLKQNRLRCAARAS